MQDLKYLSRRKRLFHFSSGEQQRKNKLKDLVENKSRNRRLRIILPIVAVLLGVYPLFNSVFSARNAQSSVGKGIRQAFKIPTGWGDNASRSFQLAFDHLQDARFVNGRMEAPLADGGKVVYPIYQELQERVEKVMRDFQVPYGVFVAMEPASGKILAMVSYSSIDPSWEQNSFYNLYPMASLFKIVTAAAALEKRKVSPDTVFAFRGRLTSENPRYWFVKPGKNNQEMPLDLAMGKSVNPVFGRLANDVVGRENIVSYAIRFGFNQILLPGTSLKASCSIMPDSDMELMLMGAGLCKEVKVSPIHAAAIMSALANNGVMMTPALASEIINSRGDAVYTQHGRPLRVLVNPETARQLERMLATTVRKGTSRKVFHDRRGRALLSSIDIAAKTGSINGNDPEGHYSWFAAYAPMDDPQIALAALVINRDKWKIKASYLGEQALEAFFR